MRGVKSLVLAIAIAASLAVGATSADAQEAATPAERTAAEAISQIRSPYCPGLMLEVCPSPQAELLRDSIRVAASQGRSADVIVEDVLARHGEEWRAIPKRSGVGLWAWLATPVAFLVGLAAVVAWLRSRRGPSVAVAGEMTDEDRAELEAALREFDRAEARA